MILRVFSVYDTKARAFGIPFFMGEIGAAVRAFGDLANDKQSSCAKHPSDYILFQIGEFNDSTALLTAVNPVRNLGMGSDYIGNVPAEPCGGTPGYPNTNPGAPGTGVDTPIDKPSGDDVNPSTGNCGSRVKKDHVGDPVNKQVQYDLPGVK